MSHADSKAASDGGNAWKKSVADFKALQKLLGSCGKNPSVQGMKKTNPLNFEDIFHIFDFLMRSVWNANFHIPLREAVA